MSIHIKKSIEEYILEGLQKGPRFSVLLIEEIKILRPHTTKQAVYAALRALKKQEKVVLHRKKVSLSSAWVAQMENFYAVARQHYHNDRPEDGNFLSLEDGDKISYSFKDSVATDAFWGHVFRILVEQLPQKTPVYLYNPHQWVLLARKEQEQALIDLVLARHCYYFLTVGGNTAVDRALSPLFTGKESQYCMLSAPLYANKSYYVNVIGDFVIEVWIDKSIAAKIDAFYDTQKIVNESSIEQLQKIIEGQGKSKLIISRNQRKADTIRRTLKKYFYLPK